MSWFYRSSTGDDLYIQNNYNYGAPVEYSSNRATLDEVLKLNNFSRHDVLQIDTDGFHYHVLLGAG